MCRVSSAGGLGAKAPPPPARASSDDASPEPASEPDTEEEGTCNAEKKLAREEVGE
jgi:hypothetical protein